MFDKILQLPRLRNKTAKVICFFLIYTALLSYKPIRAWLTLPLYVSDQNFTVEYAYVMANGHAYWERLHGASDLYHMKRVKKIILRDEQLLSSFNFRKQQSDRLIDRAIDYLVWNGVPRDSIETIPMQEQALLGSLGEAQQVARHRPNIQSLVVVTSAPHTRRSRLCFHRAMPKSTNLYIHSPSPPLDSVEIGEPIWIEYAKLLVYYAVA